MKGQRPLWVFLDEMRVNVVTSDGSGPKSVWAWFFWRAWFLSTSFNIVLQDITFSRFTFTSIRFTFTSFLHTYFSYIYFFLSKYCFFKVYLYLNKSSQLQASFKQASSKLQQCLYYSCLFGQKFILGLFEKGSGSILAQFLKRLILQLVNFFRRI